jgi:hypothetical protein
MRQRHGRSDDVLFISALAAVLIGVALLLVTTHAFMGVIRAWPLLVIAIGGLLIYAAIVRKSSPAFLFGGITFVLEGSFLLVSALVGMRIGVTWPLAMVVGGVAGIVAGLAAWRRPRPSFIVPSLCFICLGGLFSLFSFGLVRQSFRHFFVEWWPSLLIVGGLILFAAYGLRDRGDRRGKGRDRSGGRPPRRAPDRGS